MVKFILSVIGIIFFVLGINTTIVALYTGTLNFISIVVILAYFIFSLGFFIGAFYED